MDVGHVAIAVVAIMAIREGYYTLIRWRNWRRAKRQF